MTLPFHNSIFASYELQLIKNYFPTDYHEPHFTWSNPPLLPEYTSYIQGGKKHRNEKKSIPDDEKDEKYFERRRRNNQAAKKSRDARKIREDQIALKAAILEHENAILKAQLLTLKDEASAMRRLLFQNAKC